MRTKIAAAVFCLAFFYAAILFAEERPKESLWLPDFVKSATVEGVLGYTGSYVAPGKGSQLAGFGVKGGVVRFASQTADDPGAYAPMARAPLELQYIARHAGSGNATAIRYCAQTKRDIVVIGAPDSNLPLGEVVTDREISRVDIVPNMLDNRNGKMWIVHEEHGGVEWTILLKCELDPDRIPPWELLRTKQGRGGQYQRSE